METKFNLTISTALITDISLSIARAVIQWIVRREAPVTSGPGNLLDIAVVQVVSVTGRSPVGATQEYIHQICHYSKRTTAQFDSYVIFYLQTGYLR